MDHCMCDPCNLLERLARAELYFPDTRYIRQMVENTSLFGCTGMFPRPRDFFQEAEPPVVRQIRGFGDVSG